MKSFYLCIVSVFFLSSCATSMSKQASDVFVHQQYSNLLKDCTKIKSIQAKAEDTWHVNSAAAKAKIALREKTYDIGGDTLAITNIDKYLTGMIAEAQAQGIAFKCN